MGTCCDELGNASADLKTSHAGHHRVAVPGLVPKYSMSKIQPIIPMGRILPPRIMMTFIIISALASGPDHKSKATSYVRAKQNS